MEPQAGVRQKLNQGISPSKDFNLTTHFGKSLLWRPSVLVGIIYLGVLTFFALVHKYQVLDFVHLGTIWSEHKLDGTWGYDGQFYYQIAVNPLAAVEFMDNAAYRYQRIVYPIFVHLLSFGHPTLVPQILLAVNYASIIFSVELISQLLLKYGLNPWFSLGYGLYFGQAIGLTFCTAEPFTYFLVCLAILLLHRQALYQAAFVLGVASLSRETAVLFPVGYVIFFIIQKEWKKAIGFLSLGVVPLIIWVVILKILFGETGVTFAPSFEFVPLYGILAQAEAPRKFVLLVVLMFIPIVTNLTLGVRDLFQSKNRFCPLLWIWLMNITMLIFMSRLAYVDLVACGRIATGMALAGMAYGVRNQKKSIIFVYQYHVLTFLIYFIGVCIGIDSLIL